MGKISLPVRDKDKAYLDTWLWLPKSRIPIDTIRGALTLISNSYVGEGETIKLWRDAPNHLGVPRARVDRGSLPYPVVDLRPKSYNKIRAKSRVVLDALYPEKRTQREAFAALKRSGGGLLHVSCGTGKTVILLHAIAYWNRPVLIINDKPHILDQWRGEIERFLELDGGIGWIQGNPSTWKWKHPITLATLKSLSMHRDAVTPEMIRHFGIEIWDEIHHLPGKSYRRTADLFLGDRYGATATVDRPDGLQLVYLWHVGEAVYTCMEQDIVPKVVFLRSPTYIDINRADCCDRSGRTHLGRLRIAVAKQETEKRFVREVVSDAVQRERDILVLSFSRDQIIELHSEFASGVMHKDIPKEIRLDNLANNKLTFATNEVAKEAISKRSLDSLLFLNEVTSEITLQQAPGRIQRKGEGSREKQARVVVLWHVNVEPLYNMGMKMQRYFRSQEMLVEVL